METLKKKYEIVSLGCNCLPRTILTRGKVKPSKKEGELSCPFDLVAHPMKSIIKNLENDFEGYLDDIFFVVRKRNFLDFRKQGVWQKPDGTKFLHDKDCKINDIEKLKTRISNRINNFRGIINSDIPVLFVINAINPNKEQINELYNCLKKLCSHKKFKLAILNFSDVNLVCRKEIYLLQLTSPTEDFFKEWNKNSYRNSKLGKYVESNICRFVRNILEKDFN